jgi:hypothetical protein
MEAMGLHHQETIRSKVLSRRVKLCTIGEGSKRDPDAGRASRGVAFIHDDHLTVDARMNSSLAGVGPDAFITHGVANRDFQFQMSEMSAGMLCDVLNVLACFRWAK